MSDRTRRILVGVAVLIFAVAVFAGGFHCSRVVNPPTPQPVGIDAGPGLEEIAELEREAQREADAELERIEAKRREDLDALDEAHRAEYERVRARGPDAVLDWLNDFDRERFGDRPR